MRCGSATKTTNGGSSDKFGPPELFSITNVASVVEENSFPVRLFVSTTVRLSMRGQKGCYFNTFYEEQHIMAATIPIYQARHQRNRSAMVFMLWHWNSPRGPARDSLALTQGRIRIVGHRPG